MFVIGYFGFRRQLIKNCQKQPKPKIHETGPGKSSSNKTWMDRNLFSKGICSDHQFEPIFIQTYIQKHIQQIYKNTENHKLINNYK